MAHSVTQIQAKLSDLNYLPALAPDGTSNIDGKFGQRTLEAYNHFRATIGKGPVVQGVPAEIEADLWPDEQPAPAPKTSNPITDYLTQLAIQAVLANLKGLPIVNILSGYKTYIVGFACILTGVIAMLGWAVPPLPALDAGQGWQLVLTGLGFLGLRAAVAKTP